MSLSNQPSAHDGLGFLVNIFHISGKGLSHEGQDRCSPPGFVFFTTASCQTCQTFSSPWCDDVIKSYDTQMVFGTLEVLTVTSLLLEQSVVNLTVVGPILFPTCFETAKKFICSSLFMECNGTGEGTSSSYPDCNHV